MKPIYEFVVRANQVLLFLITIGGTAWIAHLHYENRSQRYEPPHVTIAQTPEEISSSTVTDARFLGLSSDFYIIGIVKRVVTRQEEQRRRTLGLVDHLGEYRGPGEIVNVVFMKGGERVKTLLSDEGLILDEYVSGKYHSKEITPLLFLCVSEDTDGNRVLNKYDRNDLHIVSKSIETPDMVIKGVLDLHVVSPTRLVVKTGLNTVLQFWDIDTDAQTKVEIPWM